MTSLSLEFYIEKESKYRKVFLVRLIFLTVFVRIDEIGDEKDEC